MKRQLVQQLSISAYFQKRYLNYHKRLAYVTFTVRRFVHPHAKTATTVSMHALLLHYPCYTFNKLFSICAHNNAALQNHLSLDKFGRFFFQKLRYFSNLFMHK